MDILIVLLFLLLIVAPIGTIIHEAGHALGATIVKSEQVTLTIGLGKKIGTINIKNMTIHICLFFFVGGSVQSDRHIPFRPIEWMIISLSGPLNNTIFALIFYWLMQIYTTKGLGLLFAFNLWLAIINFIPFKYKGKKSDGYSFFQAFFSIFRNRP